MSVPSTIDAGRINYILAIDVGVFLTTVVEKFEDYISLKRPNTSFVISKDEREKNLNHIFLKPFNSLLLLVYVYTNLSNS